MKNYINNYWMVLLLCCQFSLAQVTIRVTSIPSNTPAGANIHIAGTMNDWDPGDTGSILEPDGFGAYQIVIAEGIGTAEFKFTRGSWTTVEGNASGGYLPNRTITFTGSPQTINLTILTWEDLGGSGNSTAAANVQILSNNFFMPQLNRSRRIWLYLPPDYHTTDKTYPVLYMKDGQNLFDNATSFAGEWQVDETLNTLHGQGDYGAIVVGIDNGGGERLNEYSPWVNSQYGGGDGDDYMAFVAETLKPYIDANFRTRPEGEFNALIGSSMGALIATYGACEYPGLFKKVGSMSPAYWFAISDLNDYILNDVTGIENHRIYFVAGQNESSTMASHLNAVRNNLVASGVDTEETFTKIDSYGTHTEAYWRGEFGALYSWLFLNTDLNINTTTENKMQLIQTVSGNLWAEGFEHETLCRIVDLTGRVCAKITIKNGSNKLPSDLSTGIYFLKTDAFSKKVFLK